MEASNCHSHYSSKIYPEMAGIDKATAKSSTGYL